MECCSKSDEKIAAGGEGEGVSDDRRGVTWLELDARDLEFVSFSWLFTAAWAVIAAAYHSQATRLIEWTLLWTDQKTVSDIYKLQEKFKNVFCNSAVNCEKSSNGMHHLNKDKIQEASRYTYRSQQWAAS